MVKVRKEKKVGRCKVDQNVEAKRGNDCGSENVYKYISECCAICCFIPLFATILAR